MRSRQGATYRRSLAATAVLVGFALSGCQPVAGPLTAGSPAAAVAAPSSSELSAIIQTAVEDRNGTALDVPPAQHLGDAQSTSAYRAKLAKESRSAPRLVPGQDHAAGKRPRLHQVQVHPAVQRGEERSATAHKDRIGG